MVWVPYASAAIACAPPSANTRSTPAIAAAARTSGLRSPRGVGTHMMSSRTPAILAGMAFIRTDEGYAALPPGTYKPTRSSGVTRCPSVVPSASVNCHDFASCRSWYLRMRAAACSSASRCVRSSPARACSRTDGLSSSSATRTALTRSPHSGFSLYSRTAASPRLRTFSQISTTLRSTSSSNVASNEVSALRRASKPASVVESRAISSMRSRGLRELVEERLDGVALELERGLVDDEAGADRPDLLDCAQAIGAQRIAARNQIDDRVGQTHERRELHRAVEPDQIDVHALGCEVLARGLHVLGRHAQTRALAHGARIIEAFGNRDHHSARCDAEVERLVQSLAAVLEQHVLARDAELRRAVLDVSRNIGRTHDEQPQVAAARAQNEFARGVGIVERLDPRSSKQRQRFIENPAFGEREGNHS